MDIQNNIGNWSKQEKGICICPKCESENITLCICDEIVINCNNKEESIESNKKEDQIYTN